MEGGREGGGTANHHLDVYFNFTVFGWHLKTQSCVSVTCSLNTPVGGGNAQGKAIFALPGGIFLTILRVYHNKLQSATHADRQTDPGICRL